MAAAVLVAPALAQADAVSEKMKAQNKLLSQRAARVDAMRKLAERINGLAITSETKVKDFVAEDDRIETAMESWLVGAREVGEPRYTPDGICEVTMEVTLEEVVVELKRLHKQYYKGNKFRTETFDQITTHTEHRVLRETGSGAPRPEFEPRGITVVSTAVSSGSDIMSKKAWEYWMAHCTGRGRLTADRAARVDAMRRLSERINGLAITSETRVRDFVAEDDRINAAMVGFLRGAREVGTRYHENELIVEVEMEVTLQELVANLQKWHKEYYRGDRIRRQDFEKLTVTVEEKNVREVGMGVPKEEYLKDLTGAGAAAVGFVGQANQWPGSLQIKGQAALDDTNANAAQAKLMAFRGAELDARRKLAEQVNGLVIASETSVADFVAMDDQIKTAVMTYQQGVRRVPGSERLLEDGTAEVLIEIETAPLWNIVLYHQETLAKHLRR
jgi:hypothetical protein